MEYVHIDQPTIRKPVLDTLLTTEALSRVPYPSINGVNGAYRALSIPTFPTSKSGSAPLASAQQPGTSSSSDHTARSAGLHAYLPPQPLNGGAHYNHLAKAGTATLGMVQMTKPGELLGSLMGEGIADRGKKTRDGGRGSRGGGSRKRSRTGPPEEGDPRIAMDASTVPVTAPPGRGGNGCRQRTSTCEKTEKAEKNSCRKQSSQASRRGDKKGTQFVGTVPGDVLPKNGALSMTSNAPRSGLFDIYGLKTKPVDISHYVTDLSLSELVIRSCQPVVRREETPETQNMENDVPFDQEIGHLLAFLPPFNKQASNGSPPPMPSRPAAEAAAGKAGDAAVSLKSNGKARPQKLLFDLESPGLAQDNESFTRMMDPSLEQSTHGNRDSVAASAAGTGNNALLEGRSLEPSQMPSTQCERSFAVEDLKLFPVEEFMTRLQLALPLSPLCSLISQVSYQGDLALPGGYPASFESRMRSIPPQPYSYPSTGITKFEAEFERGSKLGKSGNRPWRRCETSGRDGAHQNGYDEAGPVDLRELGVGNGASVKDLVTATSGNEQSLSLRDEKMAERAEVDQQASMPQHDAGIAVPMEVEDREGGSNVLKEDENHGTRASRSQDGSALEAALPERETPDLTPVLNVRNPVKVEQDTEDMEARVGEGSRLGDTTMCATTSETLLQSREVVWPRSPRSEIAASILMDLSRSSERCEVPTVVSRRRPFQSYPGAPTQRAAKSLKIVQLVGGTSGASGSGDSRDGLDGGNVPPNKALVSEKRKSLSQVTESSPGMAKSTPPLPSRGSACGLRGSIGSTGGRVNGWAKGINKVAGRAAASPAAAAVAAAGSSKAFNSPTSAVKGALRTKLCKGTAAAKAPIPQKVGTAKTSKASLGAMPPHSLVTATGPQCSTVKSNRHTVPLSSEGKKTKGKAGSKD